ncbi:MAG TPA: hypothetical protein VM733_06375 [Thermoanaerobaculia bacterium]|nr:hypothetical protein [Thermoanaerobaculia bacterium]
MESNDYRLERWLAVLLALLFFLPFVAKADDVAWANAIYHGSEMPFKDGEEFLALMPSDVLAPVRIRVTREHDPLIDPENKNTGKYVAVPGFADYSLILRGKALHPGKITSATPDYLEPAKDKKLTITLGDTKSHVFYRCTKSDCDFMLETDGVAQALFTIEKEMLMEVVHIINFAGDLDHDGRLDLVMNASRHWNEGRPTLFLSTSAKSGQLVGKAAELPMTGC